MGYIWIKGRKFQVYKDNSFFKRKRFKKKRKVFKNNKKISESKFTPSELKTMNEAKGLMREYFKILLRKDGDE